MSPPCESYLTADRSSTEPETFYPLDVGVRRSACWCSCRSTSTRARSSSEYAYFSSYSDSWVEHAAATSTAMTSGCGLGADSLVVEVASNDGYLLQHFVAAGCRCSGIEPAANVARDGASSAASRPRSRSSASRPGRTSPRGTAGPTWSSPTTSTRTCPTSSISRRGLRALVADDGWLTIEFQHLLRLIERSQYDTIYHEHFQYYTLLTLPAGARERRAALVDVEELRHPRRVAAGARPAGRDARASRATRSRAVLAAEQRPACTPSTGTAGSPTRVAADQARPARVPARTRRARARRVAGYGAPGKGNTLLNHCGIRTDLLALHRRPQPLQAREVPARHAHPGPPARAAGRPGPTTSSSCPGTCAREIDAAAGLRPRLGWRGSSIPIPALEIV